ncbi:hypothetical protein RCL_jg15336.t1 [Rhizophagus clarus]|uniref:Uncharacterized protein n=1 Tax=Rhizophagus clarus TaxID=94130 RepID=A0A8H3QBC3_9GLOM|nr:hypothetical protein RCL_jg15336.t1 [Rhizophagus clarus]
MIGKSFNCNQQIPQNLIHETLQNISLTADFWSSRSKHSYLGVTAVWITPNFEIKDMFLLVGTQRIMLGIVYPIVQLRTDLYTSTNNEDKKDGKKLKNILLSDEKWELIDQLVKKMLLANFQVTLNRMINTIKELIFELADHSEDNAAIQQKKLLNH